MNLHIPTTSFALFMSCIYFVKGTAVASNSMLSPDQQLINFNVIAHTNNYTEQEFQIVGYTLPTIEAFWAINAFQKRELVCFIWDDRYNRYYANVFLDTETKKPTTFWLLTNSEKINQQVIPRKQIPPHPRSLDRNDIIIVYSVSGTELYLMTLMVTNVKTETLVECQRLVYCSISHLDFLDPRKTFLVRRNSRFQWQLDNAQSSRTQSTKLVIRKSCMANNRLFHHNQMLFEKNRFNYQPVMIDQTLIGRKITFENSERELLSRYYDRTGVIIGWETNDLGVIATKLWCLFSEENYPTEFRFNGENGRYEAYLPRIVDEKSLLIGKHRFLFKISKIQPDATMITNSSLQTIKPSMGDYVTIYKHSDQSLQFGKVTQASLTGDNKFEFKPLTVTNRFTKPALREGANKRPRDENSNMFELNSMDYSYYFWKGPENSIYFKPGIFTFFIDIRTNMYSVVKVSMQDETEVWKRELEIENGQYIIDSIILDFLYYLQYFRLTRIVVFVPSGLFNHLHTSMVISDRIQSIGVRPIFKKMILDINWKYAQYRKLAEKVVSSKRRNS